MMTPARRPARRVQAGASFKIGLGFAALLGLGSIMLLSQFVTVGLLTLSTAGGALLGTWCGLARSIQAFSRPREGECSAGSGRSGIIEDQALPLTLDGLVEKHTPTART